MRKLSTVERSGLCLGIVLALAGGWLALFPRESVGHIDAKRYRKDTSNFLKLSKEECRGYGMLALGVGLGLGLLSVYPLKR